MPKGIPTFSEMNSRELIVLVRGEPFAPYYLQAKLTDEQFEELGSIFEDGDKYVMDMFDTKLSIIPYHDIAED